MEIELLYSWIFIYWDLNFVVLRNWKCYETVDWERRKGAINGAFEGKACRVWLEGWNESYLQVGFCFCSDFSFTFFFSSSNYYLFNGEVLKILFCISLKVKWRDIPKKKKKCWPRCEWYFVWGLTDSNSVHFFLVSIHIPFVIF